MNPELTTSYPSPMLMPDIITSHKSSLPDTRLNNGPPFSDFASDSYYSDGTENIFCSKEEFNILRRDIIHALLELRGTDCIQRVNNLFDSVGVSNINNDGFDIKEIVKHLNKIQDDIFLVSSSSMDVKALLKEHTEQLDRLHILIRNQSLYLRHSIAQLEPAMSRAVINQPDLIDRSDLMTHSQQSKEIVSERNESERITAETSYAELWRKLADIISDIKIDYVDFYADLMLSYTEMYESFNENVQKASSNAVTAGDDGNNVAFDVDIMQAGYNSFQKDVDELNKKLGSVKDWNRMTEDEKNNMVKTLEPAFKVDSAGVITFNMDQYNTVSGSYPAGIKEGKVSTASYQAWLATFNAAGNAFQSNMQSFAQRYSQANNTFDTINKVLSSTISTLSDSARDFLR